MLVLSELVHLSVKLLWFLGWQKSVFSCFIWRMELAKLFLLLWDRLKFRLQSRILVEWIFIKCQPNLLLKYLALLYFCYLKKILYHLLFIYFFRNLNFIIFRWWFIWCLFISQWNYFGKWTHSNRYTDVLYGRWKKQCCCYFSEIYCYSLHDHNHRLISICL